MANSAGSVCGQNEEGEFSHGHWSEVSVSATRYELPARAVACKPHVACCFYASFWSSARRAREGWAGLTTSCPRAGARPVGAVRAVLQRHGGWGGQRGGRWGNEMRGAWGPAVVVSNHGGVKFQGVGAGGSGAGMSNSMQSSWVCGHSRQGPSTVCCPGGQLNAGVGRRPTMNRI